MSINYGDLKVAVRSVLLPQDVLGVAQPLLGSSSRCWPEQGARG